jgi:hypothetical protein
MTERVVEVLTNQGQQYLPRDEDLIVDRCANKLKDGRCRRLVHISP